MGSDTGSTATPDLARCSSVPGNACGDGTTAGYVVPLPVPLVARKPLQMLFLSGARAALPIAAAYGPVAFALGAAAARIGISPLHSALWSAVMFSGANQALMLSLIPAGVPLAVMALLCMAGSLRHLLYGVVLRHRVGATGLCRAVFGYGLTDEVFAVALAAAGCTSGKLKGAWLAGLSLTALTAWVAGTGLGAFAGDGLQARSPDLQEALDFALPALLIALVWSAANRARARSMGVAGVIALGLVAMGRSELAIPAGAAAAFLPAHRNH